MKLVNHFGNKVGTSIVCSSLLLAAGIVTAADNLGQDERQRLFIDEVQDLYGLDESAAIQRLASEQVASELAAVIESLNLSGYAGSWFDPETGNLAVALSDESAAATAGLFGADVKLVAHSLDELQSAH